MYVLITLATIYTRYVTRTTACVTTIGCDTGPTWFFFFSIACVSISHKKTHAFSKYKEQLGESNSALEAGAGLLTHCLRFTSSATLFREAGGWIHPSCFRPTRSFVIRQRLTSVALPARTRRTRCTTVVRKRNSFASVKSKLKLFNIATLPAFDWIMLSQIEKLSLGIHKIEGWAFLFVISIRLLTICTNTCRPCFSSGNSFICQSYLNHY